MRSVLNAICFILVTVALLGGQTPGTNPASAPKTSSGADNLPSQATVDSFLHQQFGYKPDVTWKISGIKPSEVAGLSEVDVVLANSQGQQPTHFYVGPDGKRALVGEMIPFGAHPADPATNASDSAAKPADPAIKPAGPAKSASSGSTSLPSEATVDTFLHQQFAKKPDVTWKIANIKPSEIPALAEVSVVLASPQGQQMAKFYVGADREHALVGEIIPFGTRPFDPIRQTLDKGVTGPSRGPKDAPVTIVEFGDLQCPACKQAQQPIEQLVAAEPKARFVFQNFPLEMHNWALKGAEYADCVGRASNDAFWKFISKTYDTQADITAENADEKLTAVAEGSGVKGSEIAACAAKPETKARVDASIALGKSVEVGSTPTLFINGRRIGSFDPRLADIYKSIVDFAAKN
jgi:protein-disulfide isomerase